MARKRIKKSRERLAADEAERHRLAQYTNPNQVLTFHQWCLLNTISHNLGRKILNSDNGPATVKLGLRRIGITVGSNQTWQKAAPDKRKAAMSNNPPFSGLTGEAFLDDLLDTLLALKQGFADGYAATGKRADSVSISFTEPQLSTLIAPIRAWTRRR
jgi:hypothetical protein